MSFFSNFIPLISGYFQNFTYLPYLFAFGALCAIPSLIKEVIGYV